jgi:hypothetical protein
MSLFDKDIIESPTITAQTIFNLHDSVSKNIGHSAVDYMYSRDDFQCLDFIPEETIDSVINDVVSYIYYYVKLGLDNHTVSVSRFTTDFPAEIFGITPYNQGTATGEKMIKKITYKFKILGFDVWLLDHDNVFKINWNCAKEYGIINE